MLGLGRSEASAQKLKALQVKPVLGILQDREELIEAEYKADAVIYTPFIHDYNDFAGSGQTEQLKG